MDRTFLLIKNIAGRKCYSIISSDAMPIVPKQERSQNGGEVVDLFEIHQRFAPLTLSTIVELYEKDPAVLRKPAPPPAPGAGPRPLHSTDRLPTPVVPPWMTKDAETPSAEAAGPDEGRHDREPRTEDRAAGGGGDPAPSHDVSLADRVG